MFENVSAAAMALYDECLHYRNFIVPVMYIYHSYAMSIGCAKIKILFTKFSPSYKKHILVKSKQQSQARSSKECLNQNDSSKPFCTSKI